MELGTGAGQVERAPWVFIRPEGALLGSFKGKRVQEALGNAFTATADRTSGGSAFLKETQRSLLEVFKGGNK